MRRLVFATVVLAALFSACVSLHKVTEADVPRAQSFDPKATFASLQQGRDLYVHHCSGCHTLHVPEERTVTEWKPIIQDMSKDAHMTEDEVGLVTQYILTFAKPDHGG